MSKLDDCECLRTYKQRLQVMKAGFSCQHCGRKYTRSENCEHKEYFRRFTATHGPVDVCKVCHKERIVKER
jgi:hypothetical protein